MTFELGTLLAIIGALTLGVTVITEVLKHTFPKLPSQLAALIISFVLTIGAYFGYISANNLPIQWYEIGEAAIGSFFVSYSAQFGFDKLKELIEKFKGDAD
jgi:hypothetical protein